MSGVAVGQHRVRARKQHNCFLCTVPISVGTEHDTWTWIDDSQPIRMRVHDGCKSYAHDNLDGWTDGDGVDDNAVETDLWERLVYINDDEIYVVNEEEASEVLRLWPGLADVVQRVRDEAAANNAPDAPEGS